MNKVCVLGAGSWGTALAILLNKNGHSVYVWGRPEDGVETAQKRRENIRFLPGVSIPPGVVLTSHMHEAMDKASLIVFSVPSQALRTVLEQSSEYITGSMYLVNTAKGLEISTGMRLSQVAEQVLGNGIRERFAVLSGPSHAEEVARDLPAAVTLAAYRKDTAVSIQEYFMSELFRVYTNPDMSGVELGGALKNIIALATGIAYGLGYGDNTAAALMTRGLTEMIRMGEAMGGEPRTFAGLSGIGDLVVTCGSRHSRNRRAGEMIGQGQSLPETLAAVGMVVEGVYTTQVVYRLAREKGIEMPITTACYNILYEGKDIRSEVTGLMTRQKKHEIEEIALNLSDW